MLPKTRLGKRSPFGALVSSACSAAEAAKTGFTAAMGSEQAGISRVKGHGDLKVYFQCAGSGEGSGVLDPFSNAPADAAVSASFHHGSRSVSSCIDVPRSSRGAQEVDMDELMAAMVLSSLSCSPPPKAVPPPNCAGPSVESGPELSDSGSSGHWSVDVANGSSAPSSPATAEPESETLVPPDEGLDMELDQVLFDEPAPRKRRNSVKVAYRCLWPSCGKVLTSVVGIKRHIRTTHLWRGGEHERCSRSEEDFYYTEINQPQSPPHPLLCGPGPASSSSSPSSPPSPPPPSPPSPPGCDSLSRSAPSPCGSSWQVQSEHSYQAPPPSHMVLPAPPTLCRLTTAPVTCSRPGSTFRVRSVSVGEQWLQHQGAPCRRIRSEAKKCRKVYGIEHRDQWCTACRWKKACQRFLD
ncbi:zinc finger protein 395a [Oryzias melastigma]|uniref:zinc finger protein 395a n=1 Tax=Oryzias melastigma TaxID=30732 RepID=UPI000CF7D67B|nr:zinc finger protein 395a [Oryzias melastigma]XP_024151592.1 zinc finger protein 395a [Oryzias melastigma]